VLVNLKGGERWDLPQKVRFRTDQRGRSIRVERKVRSATPLPTGAASLQSPLFLTPPVQ